MAIGEVGDKTGGDRSREHCMLNCIYIYSFIPMSGCVSMGPSALLFPGARDAVNTALLLLLLSKKQ